MIRRTLDATFLNEVANHPDVRPWIGGEGEVDLAPIVEDLDNLAIVTQYGGWVLHHVGPGVYEIHSLFLKEGRGRHFRDAAFEMLRWVFTHTDGVEILTKVPDNNRGAGMACAWVGFRERFHRENAWLEGVGVSFRALTIDDWYVRDPLTQKAGQAFHEAVEIAKGPTGEHHPEDPAHDQAAGAAVLMAQAGNMAKAVAFYNRWSVFAGYQTIEQIGAQIVDIRDAMVEISPQAINVLRLTPASH